MAWGKVGTETLSAAGDIDLSAFTSTKFNVLLSWTKPESTHNQCAYRFGNGSIDTGSNYAERYSRDGGTDGTATSQADLDLWANTTQNYNQLTVSHVINIATEEKLEITHGVDANAAGAANAPRRIERVGKWANTSNQFDYARIYEKNGGAEDMASDSNLTILGSDLTPASATSIETGSIYIDTDTASRWWYDGTYWNMQPTYQTDFSSSTGWTTVGSNVTITGGELSASSVDASGDNRIYYPLGFTLEDNFVARWEHTPKGVSNNNVFLPIMNFTAGTGNLSTSTNQDRVYLFTDASSQALYLRGQDGTTAGTNSNTQVLTTNTKYYLELVKNGTSGTVYVRTGSHSGTLVNTLTTTIASGITGLTHVQSGAMTGGNAGTGSYTVDNLKIYNGVTSVQQ